MCRKWLKALWAIENPENERHRWVRAKLAALPQGASLLDAGCGTQPFREDCGHLAYKAQDFGQYDGKGDGSGLQDGTFPYGKLDYTCDIWNIPEKDASFDAVLCTEVIEHVPFPAETVTELCRLLRPGGSLILTAPYACLPHMSPYFFFSGFSLEFYEKFLKEAGMELVEVTRNGNIFGFTFQEFRRGLGLVNNPALKILYLAAFIVAAPVLKLAMKTTPTGAADGLHFGYHILARKKGQSS